jgi:mutator protein MutT
VKTLVVTAAIIRRGDRFLVTQRQPGSHLAGLWEFPGGKCAEGEELAACMARELAEELGIAATVGPEVFTVTHEYDDRRVRLHFFECHSADEPSPILGQQMRWVDGRELSTLEFPPADAELIDRLTRRKAP